jgi:hypothetical protein
VQKLLYGNSAAQRVWVDEKLLRRDAFSVLKKRKKSFFFLFLSRAKRASAIRGRPRAKGVP